MTNIMKNCIGDVLQDKILLEMEQSPYSLLIDGSSSILGSKYLAIMVRYLKPNEDLPTTKLIPIVDIGTTSTGESLYTKFKALYDGNSKLKANFAGISTDNGPNLISSKGNEVNIQGSGLVNRLKKDSPHIVYVRDACHLFNLVIEEALKELPIYIIQFVKDISSHFSSSQRMSFFHEIQTKAGVLVPLNITSYVSTRWESLSDCVERIIQTWSHLENYFKVVDSPIEKCIKDSEYELYINLLYIHTNS